MVCKAGDRYFQVLARCGDGETEKGEGVRRVKYFPIAIIVLFSGAAIEALIRRDGHMFFFYASSALINYVVAY